MTQNRGAHFNKSARKSGGDKWLNILIDRVDKPSKDLKQLSIQCFEGRHQDCDGKSGLLLNFVADHCECRHHAGK